jgi:hypothetical protein
MPFGIAVDVKTIYNNVVLGVLGECNFVAIHYVDLPMSVPLGESCFFLVIMLLAPLAVLFPGGIYFMPVSMASIGFVVVRRLFRTRTSGLSVFGALVINVMGVALMTWFTDLADRPLSMLLAFPQWLVVHWALLVAMWCIALTGGPSPEIQKELKDSLSNLH